MPAGSHPLARNHTVPPTCMRAGGGHGPTPRGAGAGRGHAAAPRARRERGASPPPPPSPFRGEKPSGKRAQQRAGRGGGGPPADVHALTSREYEHTPPSPDPSGGRSPHAPAM